MKKKLLATAVAVAVGGAVLSGVTQAAEVIEATVGGIPTLTICDDNDSTHCISMMDRNLGATTNDITSTGSYGNHYKWGNNYGFSPWESVTTSNQQIDCSSYGPSNPFSSSTFYIGDYYHQYYCSSMNANLWGMGNISNLYNQYGYGVEFQFQEDVTVSDKRGPCNEGYHVPSESEWRDLIGIWNGTDSCGESKCSRNNNNGAITKFKSDFKIPFAGYRDRDGEVDKLGEAYLWSSSPREDGAEYFHMSDFEAGLDTDFFLGEAKSVRCFKDTPVDFSAIGSESEGNTGDKSAEIYLTVEGGDVIIGTDTGAGGTLTKNLGTIGVSNDIQVLTGAFGANAFWIEDMKGNESGYYTTLSVSDMVGDENSGHVIPKANIQFKPSEVTKISGAEVSDSKVVLGSGWNDWTNNSWEGNQSTVTYFNRQNTSIAEAGRVGRWGDNLQIKVSVPAHTVEDIYRGVVTYTLYEL